MRYITLILVCFSLFSCPSSLLSEEERYEQCPYELKYGSGAHYLHVPITMIPHKMVYKVGDTLTIRMNFPDSIYDISKDVVFEIKDFPFEPATLLYRIRENGWDSGYRINELLVEDKYNTRYNFQSELSDDMRGFSIYENGRYDFEYKIVFESTGTYCTVISDQYQVNLASGNEILNADIDAIDFEGKCKPGGFYICNVIDGDPHYDEFKDELEYLDTEIYRDNLIRLGNEEFEKLGKGSVPIDWQGYFCFSVEE